MAGQSLISALTEALKLEEDGQPLARWLARQPEERRPLLADALAIARGLAAPVPRTIGAYRVLGVLGRGGMATVYLAVAARRVPGVPRGRKLALKVIDPAVLREPSALERFLHEADLGRRIRHPGVVRTYDVGVSEADGARLPFLVMERVEGRTLRALREELGSAPEGLCREIALSVAIALRAVHATGAIHRDVKPDNILVTPRAVKLMDFGVARPPDDGLLSGDGAFLGSLPYAAPEQARGEPVDGRADLYSLGVVLYELACGSLPGPRFEPRLSPFFEAVLRTLLEPRPKDRFASAAELLGVLRAGEESPWWSRHSRPEPRPASGLRLQGRAEEFKRLLEACRRASRGDGHAVVLEGEAGIGKSRLLAAFLERLADEEPAPLVLAGAYVPGEGPDADGLVSAFRDYSRGRRWELGRLLADAPPLARALEARLSGAQDPASLSADALRAAFVRASEALASRRPLVIALEDAHLALEDARRLLANVAAGAKGRRVLVVATARTGAGAPPLRKLGNVEVIRLVPLPRPAVEALVEEALGPGRPERRVVDRVCGAAGGNPFFALEMVRAHRAGRGARMPRSVLAAVDARLAELGAEDRRILEVAACCGPEFDGAMVAAATGMPRIALVARLAGLERIHGLVRHAGGRHRFDHPLVHERLLRQPPARLARHHAALAAALVRGRRKDPAELCRHLLAAGEVERSLPHLDAAIDRLEARHAHAAAARLGDAALAVKGLLRGRRRIDQLLRRAEQAERLGRPQEERAALLEARGLAGGARERARVLSRLGRYLERAEGPRRAIPVLGRALALARAARDRETECLVLNAAGEAHQVLGRHAEARRRHELALALCRRRGDARGEARARGGLGAVLFALGRYEDALREHRLALEISRRERDPAAEARATAAIAAVLFRRGDLRGSRGTAARLARLARRTGDRHSEAGAELLLGRALLALSRRSDAAPHFERARSISCEIGDWRGEALALQGLWKLRVDEGRYAEALACSERSSIIGRRSGSAMIQALDLFNIGWIRGQFGDHGKARRTLLRSLALCRATGMRTGVGACLRRLAENDWNRGRPLGAVRRGYERALQVLREVKDDGECSMALVALGAVLAREGRHGEARARLGEASELARSRADPEGILLAGARLASLPGGSARGLARMLERLDAGLPCKTHMVVALELWRATGEESHLLDAYRQLRRVVDQAPAELRPKLLRATAVHREIVEAWSGAKPK